MGYPVIKLKSGKDRPLIKGHPWLFSGAIKETQGDPQPGDIVTVTTNKGRNLGVGYYNPASQISVRLLSRDSSLEINQEFIDSVIASAFLRREVLRSQGITAYRLIHAEADKLPGVIADIFSDFVVLQFHTLGAEKLREKVIAALLKIVKPTGIYERSNLQVRRHEGIEPGNVGLIAGSEPPEELLIAEAGLKFAVDMVTGQKTGFFIDQRDNRARIQQLAAGKSVLNLFSYTGATSVAALAGGATDVTSVDIDADALALTDRNIELNSLDPEKHTAINSDVKEYLNENREQQFDIIINDPPAFAKHRRAVGGAVQAYKTLNANVMKMVKTGGYLLTCSCSGLVDKNAFREMLAEAANFAAVDIIILGEYPQPLDHPTLPAYREGEYLKSTLLHINHKY